MLALTTKEVRILILNEDDMILLNSLPALMKATRGMKYDAICLPREYHEDYKEMEFWNVVAPTVMQGDKMHGVIKFY